MISKQSTGIDHKVSEVTAMSVISVKVYLVGLWLLIPPVNPGDTLRVLGVNASCAHGLGEHSLIAHYCQEASDECRCQQRLMLGPMNCDMTSSGVSAEVVRFTWSDPGATFGRLVSQCDEPSQSRPSDPELVVCDGLGRVDPAVDLPNARFPAKRVEAADFDWIAPLTEPYTGSSSPRVEIKDKCLRGDKECREVGAIVEFGEGVVSTCKFETLEEWIFDKTSRDIEGRIGWIDFDWGSSFDPRPMARVAVVEFSREFTEDLMLTMETSYGRRISLDHRVRRCDADGVGGDDDYCVHVVLSNIPHDPGLGPNLRSPHFMVYYDLLKSQIYDEYRPSPVAVAGDLTVAPRRLPSELGFDLCSVPVIIHGPDGSCSVKGVGGSSDLVICPLARP